MTFPFSTATYFYLKYASHTSSGFTPFINSIVHVLMYSYYAVSAYNRSSGIWWKKYVTQLQLIQFALCALHSAYFIFIDNCARPKIYHGLEMVHGLLFLKTFGSFYVQNYVTHSLSKAKKS